MRKKKKPRNQRKNYGYGNQLHYAFKQALDDLFGVKDHCGTRRSHKKRALIFSRFCRKHGINDARDITQLVLEDYASYLKYRLENEYIWSSDEIDTTISVPYAHNLISTANIAMLAIRNDKKIKLSAKHALGKSRSNVRKNPIHADTSDVQAAAEVMTAKGYPRVAAVVLLCRAYGMRVQEAMLQDLKRMDREIINNGKVRILEGTKGGRKCDSRAIPANNERKKALDFALSVKPKNSKCLLSETDNVKSFMHGEMNKCRETLKSCGIPTYRELRAGFAEDVYEEYVNGPSPLKEKSTNRQLDLEARQEVAKLLGHNRPSVSSSYVGGY